MEWSLVRVSAKMLDELLTAEKLFLTVRALKHCVHRLPSSTSVLLGTVHQLMLCQFVSSRKPSPTVTDVRPLITVQDEVVGQFRCCLELHVAPRTVKEFDGNDVLRLHWLQLH